MAKTEAKVSEKKFSKERIIHDAVCYVVVAYVAVLSFMLVNAKVELTNAQTDAISSQIAVAHAID